MQRTELSSTSLKGAGYCFQEALLELEFRSGAIYRFDGVPEATYQELLRAESKGVYFNHHIRNRFPHTKMR
jgi:hypothetical protein